MSDGYVIFIPIDPELIPDEMVQQNGLDLLKRLTPDADDVSKWTSLKTAFMDQGANFDSLKCPFCKTELDIKWWGQAMDNAFDGEGFGSLEIETPCCHSPSSLNDLAYDFPAGFARFGLEARNPNITDLQAREVLSELERILGCPLKLIWAHY